MENEYVFNVEQTCYKGLIDSCCIMQVHFIMRLSNTKKSYDIFLHELTEATRLSSINAINLTPSDNYTTWHVTRVASQIIIFLFCFMLN